MRAQEIRKEALSKLEGNWIPMIGVCLLTAIAIAALNWLSVLLIPLLIPGLCAFTLKLIRGAKPEITDLVSTYKNYLNALVAYVLFAVIIAVWTFLCAPYDCLLSFTCHSGGYFLLYVFPDFLPPCRQSADWGG